MKNRFLALSVLLGCLALTGCDPKVDAKVNEVTIEGNKNYEANYLGVSEVNFAVDVNSTKQISLKAIPSIVAQESVTYTSSDTSVATVSETGLVTGVSQGLTKITVATKDGKHSVPINVFVRSSTTAGAISDAVNAIDAAYKDASYEAPKKVHSVEWDYEGFTKNGVLDHGYESMQEIQFDFDEGYFMVSSNDIHVKAPNGNSVRSSGKWIFYVVSDYEARLFHITDSTKTYCPAYSMGGYEGEDRRAQIIYDILDMFFVSGHGIVTNVLDDMSGKSDFEDFGSMMTEKPNAVKTFGDNCLSFNYTETGDSMAISATNELNGIEIPAGTKVSYNFKEDIYFKGASCPGYDYNIVMNYTKNGNENWSRDFRMHKEFMADFTPEKFTDPKNNGFKEVTTIFDL